MRLRFFVALILISSILVTAFAQEQVELITAGTYTGEITNSDPFDRYLFEGIAGQQITITMEATQGSELDSTLNLYDANGVLIQADDDSAGNRNARIVFIPQVNGTFTIEATRYSNSPDPSTGDYNLILSLATTTGSINPLDIPPDFSVAFEMLDLNDSISASFTTGGNLQYFVIGAEQGDFIRVELMNDASLSANIRMLTRINQTLSVISRSAQSTATTQVIFATIPQTGWYLIEVERLAGVGAYTITPTLVSDTLLSSETPTQAAFEGADDSLFFVFNGTINERVFVNLTVLDGNNLEPEISIFDLSQNQLEQRSSQGSQVRANLSVPRSSPYIVQVHNLGTGSGNFELQLRRIPVDISKLPIKEATYNDQYLGVVNNITPIEYYRFSGKAGELVTVEMNNRSGNLDPYLILADSTLNELVFNDNASASQSARVAQFALPSDGDYFILATRAGLSRGSTEGAYALEITVGEIQVEVGQLTATLTWEGEADLNLFVRTPDYTVSWANPSSPDGGILQIDSNTGCETPTAQPIEHIYWNNEAELDEGDYTIWVWYQNRCMMSGETPFTLTVSHRNEQILPPSSPEVQTLSLAPGERFEASIRINSSGNAFVVERGTIRTPSPQQTESQGGDTLIVYGDPITGSITDEVFAQFYQFEGSEGDTVNILVERVTNNLDPIVVLRDPSDPNDEGVINDDISEQNQNAQIIYPLPHDGRYIIAVTRYGVRDGTTTGNYTLTVNRVDEAASLSE